jgi:tRNA A37 threonylcarbamoyladenosine synthetase subunit TsaC/SUA5/YrdC
MPSWMRAPARLEPTTVIDLTPMGNGGDPEVLREGRGSVQALGL